MTAAAPVWVKVCGMTREVDVEIAVAAGADAVGFIIAPQSPRVVSIERVRELGAGVPVRRVIVAVDLTPSELLHAAESADVDGVQPHGRHGYEAAQAAVDAGLFVLFPVPVADPFVMPPTPQGTVPIFDTADTSRHGGTGRTFRWDLVSGVTDPFVLAGGLGPDNVADAISAATPFGVDASSRLEAEVGIKDPGKVTAFVQEAKRS